MRTKINRFGIIEIGIAGNLQLFFANAVNTPRKYGIELRSLHIINTFPTLSRGNRLFQHRHSYGIRRILYFDITQWYRWDYFQHFVLPSVSFQHGPQCGNSAAGIISHFIGFTGRTRKENQVSFSIQLLPSTTGSKHTIMLIKESQ